jgi:hypothetical protein
MPDLPESLRQSSVPVIQVSESARLGDRDQLAMQKLLTERCEKTVLGMQKILSQRGNLIVTDPGGGSETYEGTYIEVLRGWPRVFMNNGVIAVEIMVTVA